LELIAANESFCNEKERNQLKDIKRVIHSLPDPNEFKRPLVSNLNQCVSYSDLTNSGDVVIFFGGLKKNRFIPLRVYDMYFARADMTAIYLRDDSHSLCLGGIKPLGCDRNETVKKIADTLSSIGCKRLLSVGTSAGAFSAIQYGLELDAKRILAFSPPTEIGTEFLNTIEDRRGRVLLKRLEREYSSHDRSLKKQIETKEFVPPIEIVVGEKMPVDNAHARKLESYPNVSIREITGYSKHRSVLPYLMNGTISELLSW